MPDTIRLIYHIGFSLNILLPLLCAAWVLTKGKDRRINWTWAPLHLDDGHMNP